MNENLKAFYQRLSEDESLAQEFKALTESLKKDYTKAIVDFAQAHGIELAEADLAKPQDEALSDDDLGLVAGGYSWFDTWDDDKPSFSRGDNWNF